MEGNIRRMQALCDEHGVALRPHVKTHKIPEIAKGQLAAGGRGITCQTIGEAEVMADAGIDDILITYNILGKTKLRRLRALAERVRLGVVCDNETVARALSSALAGAEKPLDVLVECDANSGAKRCAKSPGGCRAGRADRRFAGPAFCRADVLSHHRSDR